MDAFVKYVNTVLSKVKANDSQYDMSGDKNLWILKPGGSSCGRGIKVMTGYNEIINHIKTSKGRHWVV